MDSAFTLADLCTTTAIDADHPNHCRHCPVATVVTIDHCLCRHCGRTKWARVTWFKVQGSHHIDESIRHVCHTVVSPTNSTNRIPHHHKHLQTVQIPPAITSKHRRHHRMTTKSSRLSYQTTLTKSCRMPPLTQITTKQCRFCQRSLCDCIGDCNISGANRSGRNFRGQNQASNRQSPILCWLPLITTANHTESAVGHQLGRAPQLRLTLFHILPVMPV